jgi:integrase
MHDLRHSFASFLASAGLPLSIIGALLGHTQPSTTARYAHLFDDPLRAAAKRVGEIVTGHKPTKRRKGTKSAKVIAMKRARL